MMNAELIKALISCGSGCECAKCPYDECSCPSAEDMMLAAADALEAAEQRIAELEKQDSVEMHKKQVARIAELEAQLPKEGEWKKILQNSDGTSDYECSACLGIIMDVPDDDEHPLCSYCPNCGARMKGENRNDYQQKEIRTRACKRTERGASAERP